MKNFNPVYKSLLFVLGTTVATTTIASTATIPNTFVSGEAAIAADVNDNFSALKSAVDDNDSRISALETATGFASLSAQAFYNEDNIDDCRWHANAISSYGYYESGGDSGCRAVAGIQLPHGVTVTSLTCYLYDNNLLNGSSVFGRLHRSDFSGTQATVFSTPQAINSEDVQVLSDTTVNTAGTEIIDNQNYAYRLSIFFDDTDTADENLRVYGCTVGYQ